MLKRILAFLKNGYQSNMTTAMNNSKKSFKKRLQEIVNFKGTNRFVIVFSIVVIAVLIGVVLFGYSFFDSKQTSQKDKNSLTVKNVYYFEGTSYAICEDSSLWIWGRRLVELLGKNDGSKPTKIMDGVKSFHNGSIIKNDNSLWLWKDKNISPEKVLENVVTSDSNYAITSNGELWTWGDFLTGFDPQHSVDALLTKTLDNVNRIIENPLSWRKTVLKSDGSLWETKDNKFQKVIDDCEQVYFNRGYMFVLKKDKSIWERYLTEDNLKFVNKKLNQVKSFTIFNDRSESYYSSFSAITEDNNLYLWGSNYYGQLGDGTKNDSDNPTLVLENVARVSYNGTTVKAVQTNGTVWTWGGNGIYNEPGNKPKIDELADANDFVIERGPIYKMFLQSDFSLWDYDEEGKEYKVLEQVSTFVDDFTKYAIQENGTLWVWGDNKYLQTGSIGNDYLAKPTQVVGFKPNEPIADIELLSKSKTKTAFATSKPSIITWDENNLIESEGTLSLNMKFADFEKTYAGQYTIHKKLLYDDDNVVTEYLLGNGDLVRFFGDILCSVDVTSSKFKTTRGIRVGDSKEKLIRLYGLPTSVALINEWEYDREVFDGPYTFYVLDGSVAGFSVLLDD